MNEQPKFMFIGKQRTGKTVAYADFPKERIDNRGGMLVLSTDGKMKSIQKMRPEISLIPVDRYEDFDPDNDKDIQVMSYGPGKFEDIHANLNRMLESKVIPFTFVIDSLTTLSDAVIKYSLNVPRKKSRESDLGVVQIPDFPEWKAEANWLMSLFTDLKSLDTMVVVTAHLSIIETENIITKEVKVERSVMTGGRKIGMKMPNYFNEIYLFKNVPPTDVQNERDSRIVYTYPTEDCDFAGTHLDVPDEFNITLPINKPFWEQLKEYVK